MRVSGFGANQYPVSLQIREQNNIRRIQGGLGNFAVDVLLTDDMMAGMVGRCRYEMHRDHGASDTFLQRVRANGYTVNLRINGRKELSQLPAADQAALVPLMLRCATAKMFENLGADPPELGVGGFGAQAGVYCGG